MMNVQSISFSGLSGGGSTFIGLFDENQIFIFHSPVDS